MAESKLLLSTLFLCLFFTASLAGKTSAKEDDGGLPSTGLTFRTVNRRFPFKPVNHRRVELIPSGENGDFENPLYNHRHHREDGKAGEHLVFKRSDLDRFDGDMILDGIRRHRHHRRHDGDWFLNRARKFLG